MEDPAEAQIAVLPRKVAKQVDPRWAAVAESRPRMRDLFDVRQVEPAAPRGLVVRAPLRVDPRQIAADALLV